MGFKTSSPLRIVFSVFFIGMVAVFVVPFFLPSPCGNGRTVCANNLRQLYQLGAVYASTHQGKWPAATGIDLWRSFTKTSPPLISPDDLEVLLCPIKGDSVPGDCDYLGPRKPVSSLKGREALGGCTHGHPEGESSGWVLLKDGSVLELEFNDPLWASLSP